MKSRFFNYYCEFMEKLALLRAPAFCGSRDAVLVAEQTIRACTRLIPSFSGCLTVREAGRPCEWRSYGE